jgi:hypothetical protein
MKSIRQLARLAALGGVLLVGGCGFLGIGGKTQPPCPGVVAPRDAATLVRYAEGAGRDLTDVVFEARVADFAGTCSYNRAGTMVDFDLGVVFDVIRGPAAERNSVSFEYFVAIPAFHPAPEGKRIFRFEATFEGNRHRIRAGDRIRLAIPMEPGTTGEDYPVYVGFQLTPDELEANRRRMAE